VQGHPLATGAAAVGAAFFPNTISCGATTPLLELFSSAGGDPILFDVNGTRLTTPVMRQKPDFVGPDGGNDTFLGFTIAGTGFDDNSTVAACANNASFPNFFGTSAAAPHVASIAALFLQADPALTPTQIYSFMQQTAAPMGVTPDPATGTYNFDAGYGFVQANLAAQMIPAIIPGAPTLTLASASIAVGSSTTITWSSVNTTGCTASGSWSGALASDGTQTVSPPAVGSDTYTLICSNVAGPSTASSVTLSVTAAATPPPSSGGGGGGVLGLSTLLGLFALWCARARHLLRSRADARLRIR
jgi:Subtilase family